MMAAHTLVAVVQVVRLHSGFFLVLGFLASILTAYWIFAVVPYRQGRTQQLLSPWHVARPAVPGVLERYATWEWVQESGLTPFGRWLYMELERQSLSLAEVAERADLSVEDLLALISTTAGHDTDPTMIRALAGLLGAEKPLIERLLRAELAAARND